MNEPRGRVPGFDSIELEREHLEAGDQEMRGTHRDSPLEPIAGDRNLSNRFGVSSSLPDSGDAAMSAEPDEPPQSSASIDKSEKTSASHAARTLDFDLLGYHYWRECHYCGYAGGGHLHCMHDGFQNPCPKCGARMATIVGDCHCEFVLTHDDIREAIEPTTTTNESWKALGIVIALLLGGLAFVSGIYVAIHG